MFYVEANNCLIYQWVAAACTKTVDLGSIFVGFDQSFVDVICPKTWFSRFIYISVTKRQTVVHFVHKLKPNSLYRAARFGNFKEILG